MLLKKALQSSFFRMLISFYLVQKKYHNIVNRGSHPFVFSIALRVSIMCLAVVVNFHEMTKHQNLPVNDWLI